MRKALYILVLGIGAGAGWWLAQLRREPGSAAPAAASGAADRQLLDRIAALEKERDGLRRAQGLPQAPAQPHSVPSSARISPDDSVTRQELVTLLNEKREKLAAAESAASELAERIHQLETRMRETALESGKLGAALKDLEERFETSVKLNEALQTESRAREVRLAQLEITNRELKRGSEDSGKQAARLKQLVSQMQDLSRRRDGYLNSILRRYREVTELSRTFAGGETVGATDMSRLQSIIVLADEDLRQLNALNAQANRVQRELAELR